MARDPGDDAPEWSLHWIARARTSAQRVGSACDVLAVGLAGAAEDDEHAEELGEALFPGAAGGEAGGEVVEGEWGWAGGEGVGDGADLVDGVFRPGLGFDGETGVGKPGSKSNLKPGLEKDFMCEGWLNPVAERR